MDHQKIVEELEALRVRIGRHMMSLDSMDPAEQNNTLLCDLEKMRKIAGKLEKK